eukprot:TRINITY_DN84240_c0_g1_i1.p1 TRINITY_DN84240_c0_g1~~TRINITY_DN84240_c0_g1_i1.p1  ORF type:complete len:185 (-),score=11.38 TRINITY_DN84240_c0_g1_i1:30-584(-)
MSDNYGYFLLLTGNLPTPAPDADTIRSTTAAMEVMDSYRSSSTWQDMCADLQRLGRCGDTFQEALIRELFEGTKDWNAHPQRVFSSPKKRVAGVDYFEMSLHLPFDNGTIQVNVPVTQHAEDVAKKEATATLQSVALSNTGLHSVWFIVDTFTGVIKEIWIHFDNHGSDAVADVSGCKKGNAND